MFGHHRPTSETPATIGPPADGPMMARFKWYLDPPSHHQLKKKKKKMMKKKKKRKNKKKKKKKKKNFVKVKPPLTKLSGSAHANSIEPHLDLYCLMMSIY